MATFSVFYTRKHNTYVGTLNEDGRILYKNKQYDNITDFAYATCPDGETYNYMFVDNIIFKDDDERICIRYGSAKCDISTYCSFYDLDSQQRLQEIYKYLCKCVDETENIESNEILMFKQYIDNEKNKWSSEEKLSVIRIMAKIIDNLSN